MRLIDIRSYTRRHGDWPGNDVTFIGMRNTAFDTIKLDSCTSGDFKININLFYDRTLDLENISARRWWANIRIYLPCTCIMCVCTRSLVHVVPICCAEVPKSEGRQLGHVCRETDRQNTSAELRLSLATCIYTLQNRWVRTTSLFLFQGPSIIGWGGTNRKQHVIIISPT